MRSLALLFLLAGAATSAFRDGQETVVPAAESKTNAAAMNGLTIRADPFHGSAGYHAQHGEMEPLGTDPGQNARGLCLQRAARAVPLPESRMIPVETSDQREKPSSSGAPATAKPATPR
jgi:hypothetical protein